MSEPQKPSCVDCVHAVFEDYGYSNYTREGTDFTCKLGLHPRGTFDRFYGRDPKFAYAAECSRFEEGENESHLTECPYDCHCEGTPYERTIRRRIHDE